MKTTKTQIEAEQWIGVQVTHKIFDDPKYCCGMNSQCPQILNNECKLFGEQLIFETKKPSSLGLLKCDQCKEAWKKAKEEEKNKWKAVFKHEKGCLKFSHHESAEPQ